MFIFILYAAGHTDARGPDRDRGDTSRGRGRRACANAPESASGRESDLVNGNVIGIVQEIGNGASSPNQKKPRKKKKRNNTKFLFCHVVLRC